MQNHYSAGRAKLADERWAKYKFLTILSSAGLLSGLVIDGLVESPVGRYLGHLSLVGFAVYGLFGAILGVALAANGMLGLGGIWKAFLLPVPVAVAYFISYVVAIAVELGLAHWGNSSMAATVSPVSLFAGGVAGGFVVLGFISILVHSILVNPGIGFRTPVVKSIAWSPVGGILSVIGWALGPSLGMAIWYGVHGLGLTDPTETARNALGQPSHVFALSVVWQTGIALVLAIMLWPYKAHEGSSNNADVSKKPQTLTAFPKS
jgi:hypothetical protein